VKLNLGSGNEPLAGHVNVDRRAAAGVDVVADVTRLPFAARSVDTVIASSLLEHFEDPYSVLDEIHRVLTPDGRLVARVPSPWAYIANLDRTHVFLADLKLWKEILRGYFREVRAHSEGVRYRDNTLLVLLNHVAVRLLRFHEYAQAWRLECRGTLPARTRAYIPWWLEARYRT
jgi:SAM-dependent methyltransferase